MRILVIDNYDSFTFNVAGALERLGARCDVVPSDAVRLSDLASTSADGLVISPGPCSPSRAGVSLALCEALLRGEIDKPLLGVCLGHQALAQAAGASIVRAARPVHGKAVAIRHDGLGIFRGCPSPTIVMTRYNSLVVDEGTLPPELEVTARSEYDGEIMALRHGTLPLVSVQFHPESFSSVGGEALFEAWLDDLATGMG